MSLEEVKNNLATCDLCHFRAHEINKGHVPTVGSGGNTIMVCDLAPVDNSEFLTILEKLGWPVGNTYFTSLLKCKCDKFEPEIAWTCFRSWLSQELVFVNPLAIISLGTIVDTKLKQFVSWVPIYYLPHYLYIKQNIHLQKEWSNEIKIIIQTIKYETKETMTLY